MFRDGAERLLVFRVGVERFALPLVRVTEVLDLPSVSPLPDADPTVLGMTVIRGALVTVYDAHRLLGVAAAGRSPSTLVLLDREDRPCGLAVDDAEDTLVVEEREIVPAPRGQTSDRMLFGLVRRGADLFAMLDLDAVFGIAAVVPNTTQERT